MANATILRLTRELVFIDEVLAAAAAHQMRSTDSDYFVDRRGSSEIVLLDADCSLMPSADDFMHGAPAGS